MENLIITPEKLPDNIKLKLGDNLQIKTTKNIFLESVKQFLLQTSTKEETEIQKREKGNTLLDSSSIGISSPSIKKVQILRKDGNIYLDPKGSGNPTFKKLEEVMTRYKQLLKKNATYYFGPGFMLTDSSKKSELMTILEDNEILTYEEQSSEEHQSSIVSENNSSVLLDENRFKQEKLEQEKLEKEKLKDNSERDSQSEHPDSEKLENNSEGEDNSDEGKSENKSAEENKSDEEKSENNSDEEYSSQTEDMKFIYVYDYDRSNVSFIDTLKSHLKMNVLSIKEIPENIDNSIIIVLFNKTEISPLPKKLKNIKNCIIPIKINKGSVRIKGKLNFNSEGDLYNTKSNMRIIGVIVEKINEM